MKFSRQARFQRRIQNSRTATIELFPDDLTTCEGLWDGDDDQCGENAIAVVTDEMELLDRRRLCDVHFMMHLADVIPLMHNLEQAAHSVD